MRQFCLVSKASFAPDQQSMIDNVKRGWQLYLSTYQTD